MLRFFAKGLRKLHEVKREERGFTLIELLVVIIIIGLLAAIAIPLFLAQRGRAHEAAVESDARNAAAAYITCFADKEVFADCQDPAADLGPYGFNSTDGVNTAVTGTGQDPVITSNWGAAGPPTAVFQDGKVTLTAPAP